VCFKRKKQLKILYIYFNHVKKNISFYYITTFIACLILFGVHSILAKKPRPAARLPCNNNNNHSLSQGQVRYLPTMRSKKPQIKAIKDVFLLSEHKMSANANLKRYGTSDESKMQNREKNPNSLIHAKKPRSQNMDEKT
jgi:hypothetical protein